VRRAASAALAVVLAGLAAGGCALGGLRATGGGAQRAAGSSAQRAAGSSAQRAAGNSARRARSHSAGAVAVAERSHEYPSPAPPLERAPPRASAELALALFATTYINWNAADVSARLRVLAAASVGQARSAMTLEAAQVAADQQLRAGGVANHGIVEAIAPLIGGGGDRYVVVTREWTTASASAAYQGLLPAWHVTLATVRPQGRGWVISAWQPES
jgi:hypothetical protein